MFKTILQSLLSRRVVIPRPATLFVWLSDNLEGELRKSRTHENPVRLPEVIVVYSVPL
jgi:hypothetical protein